MPAAEAADWLLARQLSEHAKGAPSSAAANLINASLMGAVFSHSFAWWWIAAAYLLLLGLIGRRLYWNRKVTAHGDRDDIELQHVSRRIELNALLLGGWWGVMLAILLVAAAPGEQMLLGILGSGMMASGSITYRTLEGAARGFTAAIGVGALLGLLLMATPIAYAATGLLLCYAVVLHLSIKRAADNFRVMNEHERALSRSSETISLLLNDYTEQGSDWLIEIDRQGLIRNPSERFASAAARPTDTLNGLQFAELIDCQTRRFECLALIASGQVIRDLSIPVDIDGDRHWWSISARPNAEADGGYRGVATDVTAQRLAEDEVRRMAHFDGLTQLPNRFLFNESLERKLAHAPKGVGLMYLDLDQFKSINDTLGHPIGDKLLKAVAGRLETCARAGDLIARLGGDEFAIIIDGENLDGIDHLAARIIETIALPFLIEGYEVMSGASIGIACAPEDGGTSETLLKNADLALYAAKAEGRGRYVRFERGMGKAAETRRELELDLRSALGRNEMRLHYQPLINVASGEPSGYEALVRWEHHSRGTVMPAEFISIAEETGMVIQIGEWVIREALSEAATWPEHLSIAINLSPAQMRSTTLLPTIIQALGRSGVAPERVEFEITETVLMHDSEANIGVLNRLRQLGMRIALDDFGTGYSSLNYLRTFPFNKIKIDRCFIDDIDSRADCRAIVRSLVSLATSLGVSTTAEGVERQSQLDVLRAEGCNEVQGFLFSKAITSAQLSDLRPVSRQRRTAA